MTSVPLNGRAYTDLLSLQPGVVPSAYGSRSPGLNDRSPSGAPGASGGAGLSSGNQSVNGQRETANGFMVNGANVEEGKNNGTSIVANLEAISEFRIITNNFDAEYGNFSGGQVNVATKSRTNNIHGSTFEFFRINVPVPSGADHSGNVSDLFNAIAASGGTVGSVSSDYWAGVLQNRLQASNPGQRVPAGAPCIMQIAAKFLF